jgi:peptidoglycan/LPS O-acetylase OafA/YrhL
VRVAERDAIVASLLAFITEHPLIPVQNPPPSLAELMKRSRLPVLDGMRALAIGMVVTFHAATNLGPTLIPGDLGVTFFFVLSGFLITWLLLKEWDRTGRVSLRAFYTRRVLRIFPAYYVFIAVWGVLYFVLRPEHPGPEVVVAGLTYTVNYLNAFNGYTTPGISHAWSLAVEEQFYLLWPALFILLMRRGGRVSARTALCGIVLLVCAWRSYLYLVRGVGYPYVYNAFDTRFDSLAIGCLLALVGSSVGFAPVAARLARYDWLPLVTLVLLATSRVAVGAFHPRYAYGPGFTVDALLMAVLIVQLLQLSERGIWRVFTWAPVRFVGLVSYPLYLYHEWAITFAWRFHAASFPAGVRLAAGGAAALVAATGSYLLVERPFLRLKRRFSVVPPGAGPEVAGEVAQDDTRSLATGPATA